MTVTIEDILDQPPPVAHSPRQILAGVTAAVRLVLAAARWRFLVLATLQILAGVAAGAQVIMAAWVVGGLVTSARTGTATATLAGSLVGLIGLTTVIGLIAAAQGEQHQLLGELVRRYAVGRVLEIATTVELSELEQPEFHNRLKRAQYTAEVRPLELAVGLVDTLGAAAGTIGMTIALLTISPLLAGLVLLSAVPLWYAMARSSRARYRFSYRMTANDRERTYLSDMITGRDEAKEIRAYRLGPMLRDRYDQLYDTRIAAVRRLSRARLVASLGGGLAGAAATAAVVGVAMWLSATGRITLSQAGAAVVSVALLAPRLTAVTTGAATLYESALFIGDLTTFMMPSRVAPTGPPAPTGFTRLELHDVRFRYPGRDTDAVAGISLRIDAGEIVALVGENGSGKTTLAKLMARLYRPDAGTIAWDGVDIADLDADEVRQSVAITFQDFIRYRFTASDNVAIGRPERRDDLAAVVAAADRAGAGDLLAGLPQGYATRLGPEFHGGYDLSLGQWQRVALARAFFRDAPLVILDEPTASLDPRAEHALFSDIRQLCAGRTALIISHRLATVKDADHIYVLSHGRLVEHGSHDALMADGGRYAELFELQAEPYRRQSSAPRTSVSPVGASAGTAAEAAKRDGEFLISAIATTPEVDGSPWPPGGPPDGASAAAERALETQVRLGIGERF